MGNKLVFGVGVYAKGKFKACADGRPTPIYQCWQSMLRRCYDQKYKNEKPSYDGCVVDPRWHDFQTFAQWYEENYPKDGENYHLDKDLKVLGNKVYGPDTCLFVSRAVNNFTIDNGTRRGKYSIGVYFLRRGEVFRARCRDPINKGSIYLGHYDNELEAHLAWRKFKSDACVRLAEQQTNEEVKQALLRWKEALDNGVIHRYSS